MGIYLHYMLFYFFLNVKEKAQQLLSAYLRLSVFFSYHVSDKYIVLLYPLPLSGGCGYNYFFNVSFDK